MQEIVAFKEDAVIMETKKNDQWRNLEERHKQENQECKGKLNEAHEEIFGLKNARGTVDEKHRQEMQEYQHKLNKACDEILYLKSTLGAMQDDPMGPKYSVVKGERPAVQ